MFDWARGSVLKKMIELEVPGACYDTWLKGWAQAWPLALLSISPNSKVLDVGTACSLWYPHYFNKIGCEAHVLDGPYKKRKGGGYWGVSQEAVKQNPEIHFHVGLAGEYKIPPNSFNLITCISVMEHIYDSTLVLDPKKPYSHLNALADMASMLKPGGVLVLTYDFFLNDMPHWRGWDFLADYELLKQMGLKPLRENIIPKSRTYIYNHEDTLFMGPEGILSFANSYLRSTSIGMMFYKPGKLSKITLHVDPKISKQIFSQPEQITDPSMSEVKAILSRKAKTVVKTYIKKIRSMGRKNIKT